MKRIKDVRLLLVNVLGCLFSNIIPKKKGVWLFEPLHNHGKLSGNVKYLHDYVSEKRPYIKKKYSYINDLGGTISLIKYYFEISRAEFIITDQTNTMLALGKYPVIQLWHGTGYKNIGLLDSNFYSESKIKQFLKKKAYKQFDLIACNSEGDMERKRLSFDNENVFLTGSPRNDNFSDALSSELHSVVDAAKYKKIITYVPTYRPFVSENPFSRDFLFKLDAWLKEKNYLFIIKKHPKDTSNTAYEGLQNVLDLTRQIKNVQKLLSSTDILITDYSGIATDFSMTEKPMLFYMYDYEEFISQSHTFYYDLTSTLPGPFVYKETEILSFLQDLTWFEKETYNKHYKNFQNEFNFYNDGKSSERILNLMEQR